MDRKAIDGDKHQSPFNFQTGGIKSIEIRESGNRYQFNDLDLANDKESSQLYVAIEKYLGFWGSNNNVGLDREAYGLGYTIYPFLFNANLVGGDVESFAVETDVSASIIFDGVRTAHLNMFILSFRTDSISIDSVEYRIIINPVIDQGSDEQSYDVIRVDEQKIF